MSVLRLLPLILVLLGAAPARAWDLPDGRSSGGDCTVACGAFAGITFGLDLIIDVVDIVVLAQGGSISPGWSVVQGLWGVGHVIAGTIVSAVGALGLAVNGKDAGAVFAVGLIALGEGILLIIVAITSTVRFFAERRRKEEERRHPAVPIVSLSVDPRGGANALLSWRF